MKLIWSDFDQTSENSQKMIKAKQENGPEFWPIMREVINYDCDNLPFPRFRLWASMHIIPLVESFRHAKYLGAAFNAAFENEDWHHALLENWVGVADGSEHEFKVANDFDTSVHRIQNVAHLVLNGFKPEDFKKFKNIIEIGGGYGDMCSTIHDLGFEGKYTIFDFPEVQRIQDYYLSRANEIKVNFATKPEELEEADLIIATWSLSEIPIDLRTEIMDKISNSKNWLVAYQEHAFNKTLDNEKYFRETFKDKNPTFTLLRENDFDGKNYYMTVREN